MKIIQKFDLNEVNLVDHPFIQNCRKGKWTDWKRTFILRNLTDERIAVISLNLFERIICVMQNILGCQFYLNFNSVFGTKKVEIIPPSALKNTQKKVNDSAKTLIKHTDPKNILPQPKKKSEPKKKNDTQPPPNQDKPITDDELVLTAKKEKSQVSIDLTMTTQEDSNPKNDTQTQPNQDMPITDDELVLTAKEEESQVSIDLTMTTQEDSNPKNDTQTLIPQGNQVLTQAQKVQQHIQHGRLAEAIQANQKLPFGEGDDNNCAIAKAYFQQGNLDQALEILDKNYLESTIKNPIYREFALSCCRQAEYAAAIECINRMRPYDDQLIAEIFLNVAKEHFDKGDLAKALETAKRLKNLNVRGEEDCFIGIAQQYIQQDDLDKAAEALENIRYKFQERNQLLSTLAEKYYAKQDLDNALKFNAYDNDYKSSKSLYIQIAKDYQKQGDRAKALNALRKIVHHGCLVDAMHSDIVKDFLAKNDFENALACIKASPLRKTY